MARDVVREDVPRYLRRVGETVLSGPNNSMIVLGRDRVGGPESGVDGPGAGSVHIVAGRTTEGLDARGDHASVYVLSRSNIDDSVLPDSSRVSDQGTSGVLLVGDCVRVHARKSLRVVVGRASLTVSSDGRVDIDGDIRLGPGAVQQIVRGDAMVAALRRHVHPDAQGGVTGVTSETFSDVLSDNVRVP